MSFFNRMIQFIKESRVELKKVSWPTRQDTIRHTLTVMVMSGTVALFLGGIDFVMQFILTRFIL